MLQPVQIRNTPLQNPDQKLIPQDRQTFLIIPLQPVHIPSTVKFFVQTLSYPYKDFLQFLCINRLENILLRLQLDRFLGIFKLIVTGKKDNPGTGHLFPQLPAECQTVHKRHADVRHHHVRGILLCLLQRVLSVLRHRHNLKSDLLPCQLPRNSLPHRLFVIHQHHLVVAHVSSFLSAQEVLPLCSLT